MGNELYLPCALLTLVLLILGARLYFKPGARQTNAGRRLSLFHSLLISNADVRVVQRLREDRWYRLVERVRHIVIALTATLLSVLMIYYLCVFIARTLPLL